MIELGYPQNKQSEQFQPSFKGVDEIKPTKSNSADKVLEQFFEINPDSYAEQTRLDIENNANSATGTSLLGLDKIAENLLPFQDDTYAIGSTIKAWKNMYAYTYRKPNGAALPFFSTFTGDGTGSVNVLANGSEDTLNLISSNDTVKIVGNNTTRQFNFTINQDTVQAKTSLTIGYSDYNDYIVDSANPLATFTQLFSDLQGSPSHTLISVEDGNYTFTSTLIIPNNINFTIECSRNKAQLFAISGKAIQIGTTTVPAFAYYQTFRGFYFESIDVFSTTVLNFDECIINDIQIGDITATISYYPITISNSHLYGTLLFENAYDISIIGCYHDAVNGSPATIDRSSNIRCHSCSIRYFGAPIVLSDSGALETSRILLTDCVYENYGGAVNFFTDSRTNAASSKLFVTGAQLALTVSAGSYFAPATNYINVI